MAQGFITVSWTNTGAQQNRIDRADAGTGLWTPLRRAFVGANGANVAQLIDEVRLGIPQDYRVVSISPTHAETVIGSQLAVSITPDIHWDLGGYDVMLHIVGQGLALQAPMASKKPVKMVWNVDNEVVLCFGNVAPSIRNGLSRYRTIDFGYHILNAAQLAQLNAVIAAHMSTNAPIVYRDLFGNVIYCGLGRTQDHEMDLYQEEVIRLVEVQYVFAP